MGKKIEQKIEHEDQPQSQYEKPIILTSFIEDSLDKVSFHSFQSSEPNQFLGRYEPEPDSSNDDSDSQDPSEKEKMKSEEDNKEKLTKVVKKQRRLTKEQDLLFLNIFRPNKFLKKNNNTVRFLIDLAVEHLPHFSQCYPKEDGQKITSLCQSLREWHLTAKKNVYNCDHLTTFFADNQNQIRSKITRQVFNFILRAEALNNMKKPRSQIQDKVHYLRVAKIFSLRCRHHLLCLRNQSR